MRQWIALSVLWMSMLLLPISASAACESPIKFGALTWESGKFISGVLKYIAEDGYDCTIEEVPGAGLRLRLPCHKMTSKSSVNSG